MNAVFTIVAKNYFSLAKSLVESIRRQHGDKLDIIIGIADEIDNKDMLVGEGYQLIVGQDIGIDSYDSMAFKYNVTEFCTSIKPFFFEYLFKNKGYDKIIYFDPDILIYNKLDYIFESLDRYSIVLTPHYVTPEVIYSGNAPETLTLFAGIFNLGFLALKQNPTTTTLLNWWKHRLEHLCYADKFDALHVDQKWMDFIPSFFPKETLISHHLGCNIAFWNMHERKLLTEDGELNVVNRLSEGEKYPIIFIHYSGVDPNNIHANKQSARFNLSNYSDWLPLVEDYANTVKGHGFDTFLSLPYSFAKFSNGHTIIQFHRRIYRRLLEQNIAPVNPFDAKGNFYLSLSKNGLLLHPKKNLDKLNERNFPNFDGKVKRLNKISKYVRKVIGIEKYVILLKFCQRYFRPENQLFLLEEFEKDYKFINENI